MEEVQMHLLRGLFEFRDKKQNIVLVSSWLTYNTDNINGFESEWTDTWIRISCGSNFISPRI